MCLWVCVCVYAFVILLSSKWFSVQAWRSKVGGLQPPAQKLWRGLRRVLARAGRLVRLPSGQAPTCENTCEDPTDKCMNLRDQQFGAMFSLLSCAYVLVCLWLCECVCVCDLSESEFEAMGSTVLQTCAMKRGAKNRRGGRLRTYL